MKLLLTLALATATLTGTLSMSQAGKQIQKKPAPIIIHAAAHTAHFNDFQVRRSKDRSLELEIKKKGLDVAFTEWMQRDHPFIFAKECVKHVGEIATELKSTNHMLDFDKLMEKRSDLRLQANKYGHDVAFAEWLRTERPDVYRQHFGIKADKKAEKAKPAKVPESKSKAKDRETSTKP